MASRSERRNVCVVGVGHADGPHATGRQPYQLIAQGFGRALADAGLTKDRVDGLASAGHTGMHEVAVAEYLGLRPAWLDSTSCGGSSFEFHAHHAYRAIEAGDVDVVAICYGSNQLTANGRTLGTGGAGPRGMQPPGPMKYEFPTGLTLVGAYAMAARRHMHEFGTTPEQLASISVQMREHASRNPNAMYREPITVDDVLASPLIADPLHKLDCCVISDGGCCVLLAAEEIAADLRWSEKPVFVRGASGGTTHHSIQGMSDMTRTAAAEAGRRAFAAAGIRPSDVDVFCSYDSFTYTVLVMLEDLGFAPKGEGGAFVADGNLRLGGALPTNPDGGGLSCTHPGMRGLFLIAEATRQLRHDAGDSQVRDAAVAVCNGSGGWLSTQGTVVLGTEAR
jgi:acetyl-CoA acetyltransferase